MAPKTVSAAKRALCLAFIHRSGTAHTIKDLEKALPGAASISSLAVKDAVQAMVDENEINVEKIGSGNWYWKFAAVEGQQRANVLQSCKGELKTVCDEVARCEQEVRDKEAEMCDAEDEATEASRKAQEAENEMRESEVKNMHEELKRYADDDPVEMQRKQEALQDVKRNVMGYTDQIESMESWLKKNTGLDRETFRNMQENWYGDEYDEEEQTLRQLF